MYKEIEYICIGIIIIVSIGLCLLYYIGYTDNKNNKSIPTQIKIKQNNEIF